MTYKEIRGGRMVEKSVKRHTRQRKPRKHLATRQERKQKARL